MIFFYSAASFEHEHIVTMPLFGKSQKSPAELVKALKEAVNSLERGDKKAEKAQEDVSKNLVSVTQNRKRKLDTKKEPWRGECMSVADGGVSECECVRNGAMRARQSEATEFFFRRLFLSTCVIFQCGFLVSHDILVCIALIYFSYRHYCSGKTYIRWLGESVCRFI